jgi:hypothetical protein
MTGIIASEMGLEGVEDRGVLRDNISPNEGQECNWTISSKHLKMQTLSSEFVF